MNLPIPAPLADTQSALDDRRLAITRVGIRQLRYPLQVAIDDHNAQPTVGEWDLAVALPADQKGTHMSRFVAWLEALPAPLNAALMQTQFTAMLALLDAQAGRLQVQFPFFLRKQAPVSGLSSLLDYQGSWIVETQADGRPVVWTQVLVPVKSLCPCSKAISDYGAHNQRSHVILRAELLQSVPWLDLVRFAEESASSEIWPMLKRADEKWVTERAYDNPKFVEDLVRDTALRLRQDPRIGRYTVEVENFESIHNHSAYALIESI
jgi:GTP cyclohydrolase IB